jgi:ketosteroid isomerase-like protein
MTAGRLLIGVVAVAAAIAAYVLAFGPDDDQRIRYQLTRLGSAISMNAPSQSPLVALGHVQGELADLFDDEVRIHVPELPSLPTRRADLTRAWADASRPWQKARVSFEDVVVKLDDAKHTAIVTATVIFDGTQLDGTHHQGRRAVNLHFLKRDGSWRITSINTID